jgi:acyl-CoA thioesterase
LVPWSTGAAAIDASPASTGEQFLVEWRSPTVVAAFEVHAFAVASSTSGRGPPPAPPESTLPTMVVRGRSGIDHARPVLAPNSEADVQVPADRHRASPSRFAQQLTLDAGAGDGRYRVEVDEIWNCPLVPHGGLVAALAARAMETELDRPEQALRSISVVFAGPVQPGPVEIEVGVLRSGRSISQVTATLRNVGADAGLTALGVFGSSRPGFEFVDLTMPEAPPPDECPSFRDQPRPMEELQHFNFWEHVEGRAVSGHAPGDDWVPTTSELVMWYRFDEPPFLSSGVLDPLALVTLCDTMPGAVRERMGPVPMVWLPPSSDLTVHVFAEARSEWVLARNRARYAGDGYASAEMELWDPERGLVAYGTQVMFFSFPDGPPTPEQRRPAT